MSLRAAALVMFLTVLVLHFLYGNQRMAEEKLAIFYKQIELTRFSAAKKAIDDAVSLAPKDSRMYSWRGYARSQTLPPRCGHCFGTKAMLPGTAEQIEEAAQDYRQAIQLNDLNGVAHHNLGWLYHLSGNEQEAGRELQRAAQIDPANAVFQVSLGMWLEESEEATFTAAYTKAVELSPAMLDSRFYREFQQRKPDLAEAILIEAISNTEIALLKGPNPILRARLGKLYLFCGRYADAQRELERAVAQLQVLPRAWFNLGEIYRIEGNESLASSAYLKADILDPRLSEVEVRLAQLAERNNDRSTALQYFERALDHWQRLEPLTAAHNQRIYGGPIQTIDDMLPTTLVWYTSPCTASESFQGLARLRPNDRNRYREAANICFQFPAPHACLDPK